MTTQEILQEMHGKAFMTSTEAAYALGVSPFMLIHWEREGKLNTPIRVDKKKFYEVANIEALINARAAKKAKKVTHEEKLV